MALTKPAGCAVQVIGALFLLPGLVMLTNNGSIVGALVLIAIGGLLLWAGRQPAIRK